MLGNTALITGASAGIGAALAREFAANGHDVVPVARREDRLEDLAADLEAAGVTATPVVMDLDRHDAAADLHATVAERGLDVDVLVNNVGIGVYGPFAENDLDDERTQIRLNVTLPVELTRLFVDDLDGVLNVGSMAGFLPGPNLAGYYASKAYVNSFSQALHVELDDVAVTVVCPGPVATEFQDRAGMGNSVVGQWITNTPEAVAAAAYEGLRDGDPVVFPSRAMRAVDILGRLAPRPLLRWGGHLINRDR